VGAVLVDEARADAVLDVLVAWGLVRVVDGDVRGTPKWGARLQAAAEKLNLVAARTGATPQGNALVLAVSQALAAENRTEDETLFRDAVSLLVTLELTRMDAAKRAQYGFDLEL